MPDTKNNQRSESENYVAGDAIASVVGRKGKVRVKKIEVVKGSKIKLGDSSKTEIDANDPFFGIYQQIEAYPKDKKRILEEVDQVRQEVEKGENVRQSFLQDRLRNLATMAPDIFDVTVATLANPVFGFALAVQKIARKARSESAEAEAS